MSFELSSLGKEFKKNLEGGGKESKIWNYIHPCTPPKCEFQEIAFLHISMVSYNIFGLKVLNGIKKLWLSLSNFPFFPP